MKAVTKSKKAVVKKATPTTKAAAKTSAKKTAKVTVKSVVKTSAKAKPAPKKVAKPVAKAAPIKKAVKATPAPAKKAVAKPVKPETKAAKPVKAPAKADVKVAAKPVVKAAPAKPTAQLMTVKPVGRNAVNTAGVKPIMVKLPQNQNNTVAVKSPIVTMARPQPLAAQKAGAQGSHDNAADSARPVYRPIQVINKSLAPLQPVRQMAPVAKADEKVEFGKGDYVVYPAHGVGEIEAVETQTIGGVEIKLYAIVFEKDRMRLKVPVFKAHASGLRRLSSAGRMQDALKTLQGRAQIRRAMWSRRAQEYETKINSGDPVSIAEVLRDLKRSNDDNEQSYSERQIYQSALERLAREVAALDKISETEAAERLENMIKGRRSRAAAAKAKEEAVA